MPLMGAMGVWVGCAFALSALVAPAAAAPIEAVKVTIARASDDRNPPAADPESLAYPSLNVFQARLKGLEPGRDYAARFVVHDGADRAVQDETWRFSPAQAESDLSRNFAAYGAYPAGTWRLVLYLDGAIVAEKAIVAVLRLPEEPKPAHPPLQLLAVTLSAGITRAGDPYWPLQTVGTHAGFFYVVQARGFVPQKAYAVELTFRDGENRIFKNYRVSHTAKREEETLSYIVAPDPPPAPGTWRLRTTVDERVLAETTIEAVPGAGPRNRPAADSRLLAGSALALLFTVLYVGYHLYAFRRGAGPVAAGAGPIPYESGAPKVAPVVALLAVNLLPIALVLLGLAGAAQLVFLYWAETLIVAAYTLLRVACARAEGTNWIGYATFILAFGVAAVLYLGTVLYFLQKDPALPISPHGMIDHDVAARFELPLGWLWTLVPFALLPQVAALCVSHGISFVQNYLRGGEYLRARASEEMQRPFDRIGLLHVGIVAGGFLAVSGDQSRATATLVALVLSKTAADAWLHLRAHARARKPPDR